MYFPGDPLIPLDPIFNSVPPHARSRMIATYDHEVTEANWALGYRWDIVLRGEQGTPIDEGAIESAAGTDPVADRRPLLTPCGCSGRG